MRDANKPVAGRSDPRTRHDGVCRGGATFSRLNYSHATPWLRLLYCGGTCKPGCPCCRTASFYFDDRHLALLRLWSLQPFLDYKAEPLSKQPVKHNAALLHSVHTISGSFVYIYADPTPLFVAFGIVHVADSCFPSFVCSSFIAGS